MAHSAARRSRNISSQHDKRRSAGTGAFSSGFRISITETKRAAREINPVGSAPNLRGAQVISVNLDNFWSRVAKSIAHLGAIQMRESSPPLAVSSVFSLATAWAISTSPTGCAQRYAAAGGNAAHHSGTLVF